jgi:hypothetical protein
VKRVFEVAIAPLTEKNPTTFQVIAERAEDAIRKAKGAWRERHYHWRGGWLVHSLIHKGRAV